MRTGNEAEILKVTHHIADGGGRQIKPCGLGQGSGTNGLTIGNVTLNQCPEK
jgi:hypothetical protein